LNQHHRLPTCAPEEKGIPSSSIIAFIQEIERRGLELHGFMLLRHGHVVAKGWWVPYRPEIPHLAYSLTKSFTSTAVGFAVHEGFLATEDDVLPYFPEIRSPEILENMRNLKIKHLLTMTTGHAVDTAEFGVTKEFLRHRPDIRIGGKDERDYVRGFFESRLAHPPGTFFVYNSGASHVLGAIVERTTGMPLVEYLQPRLFAPLGIEKPAWDSVPAGGQIGGWGLRLTTEDVARFGQFLLQRGSWNGQSVLPSYWIDEATSWHVDNADSPQEGVADWKQGYGYQFWRCRHNAYRGDGAFGQFCIVMPEQDAVLAVHGGLSDMQGVLDAVWERLLPAMKEHPLEANPFDQDLLARTLDELQLDRTSPSAEAGWAGTRTYTMESNPQGILEIRISFSTDERCTLEWSDGNGTYQVSCAINRWTAAEGADGTSIAAKGRWVDGKTFALHMYPTDSPHYDKLVFHFEDARVHIRHEHLNFVTLRHDFRGAVTVREE